MDYDAMVVGAGLAGLQCARLLARRGVRLLLVDRKADVAAQVHTTGIFVRKTLEDFDIPADCLGPSVRTVTLYSPARRAQRLESTHDEFRVGRMGELYRRLLSECVRAGAEFLPETRYLSSRAADAGTEVRLAQGQREWQVTTRLLIGADGARSRVATDLGLDRNIHSIVGVEDVLRRVPLGGPARFHCFLDPRLAPGYLAWVVHDGEETHVGVGGYASRFNPVAALEEFKAGLHGIVDLRGAETVERRGGLIPVGGILRRIACPRGLLVGDAAGAVSPLTAGGLDPAVRLSTLAAKVAADYLVTGDPRVLSAYSGARFGSRFISRRWMRLALSTVRSPALIELGCAAMRVWPLRVLAWHVFFGRGSFPDVGVEHSPLAPVASQSAR